MVVFLLIVAGGWWFVREFRSISGPEKAANAFFRANSDSGPMDAYTMTAPAFQEQTPETTWANTSRRLRLTSFYAADWIDHETEGDISTVRGVIKRLNLPDIKVSVDLRRIEGNWKVSTVALEDQVGAVDQTAQAQPTMPASDSTATGQTDQVQTGLPPEETPSPVMSVPRYGGAPEQSTQASAPSALPLGRAGPPGSAVASGQVGPTCMGELWPKGFHADRVDCPIYLKTQPGLTEQCSAHAQDGSMATVTVTFLDYDPTTRESKIDCSINP